MHATQKLAQQLQYHTQTLTAISWAACVAAGAEAGARPRTTAGLIEDTLAVPN